VVNPSAKTLAEIFDYLPEKDQLTLFEFAAFLKSRAPEPESAQKEPLGIPRPEEESVVAAVKRLKQNYPMLKQKELLHEVSSHMMDHMMKGKIAVDVIDDLEDLFETKFKQMMGVED